MPAHGFDPLRLPDLPEPDERRIAIRISLQAERVLRRGHPWLYDQAITSQSHEGKPGDLAVIFDHQRKFLAIGLYDPHASIRVRILQHKKPALINQAWYRDRLAAAMELRRDLLESWADNNTTGFRLVHGENDGLPGLVIDRYADSLVMKVYTPAWIPHLQTFCTVLINLIPVERLVLRLSRAVSERPQDLYGLEDGEILYGNILQGPVLFKENGLVFEADLLQGQKTGFFFDQRENRARVEKLTGGKTVLNVFAYTGGFSVYAARGGAHKIVSVDSSLPALQVAQRNFEHNQQVPGIARAEHKIIAADAFTVLETMRENGDNFDLLVIDPPSFAQKKNQIQQAIAAYERLTQLGIKLLSPGGVLVQASCSSRVDADTFFNTVHQAAIHAGRPLLEIERSEHALDHPISFKEGAYLKCLFAVAP